jgi:hypothetical protein
MGPLANQAGGGRSAGWQWGLRLGVDGVLAQRRGIRSFFGASVIGVTGIFSRDWHASGQNLSLRHRDIMMDPSSPAGARPGPGQSPSPPSGASEPGLAAAAAAPRPAAAATTLNGRRGRMPAAVQLLSMPGLIIIVVRYHD